MRHSEPVYSFNDWSSHGPPDLSRINEVLGRYMRLDASTSDISPDTKLLHLRYHLIEKMNRSPECLSDVGTLLGEINDLIAECIYAEDDRETIATECVRHWRERLLPHYTHLCLETVRVKLRELLSVASHIDVKFALERGLKQIIPWEDLLLEEIGPAITQSDLSAQQVRYALGIIGAEYDTALTIAKL